MPNELKQSGARATDSFERRFNRSIISLTVLYAVILALILFISSSVTYSAFSGRLDRRFNGVRPPGFEDQQLPTNMPRPDDVRADLVNTLIMVNGLLLVLSIFLSYILARLTLRPIKESFDRQRRFFSDASHELRTPLSILHVDLENALADKSLGNIDREKISSNMEEVSRMINLVNNLLALSKLDENPGRIANFKSVNLTTLIHQIEKRLEPLAKSRQVEIKFMSGDSDIELSSDEDLLSHAITNLVSNAIIYNIPSGTVNIKAERADKNVLITIIDTGVGIPPEEIKNIFDRFYRADKSRSRQTGGSGLGLSIVQSAIAKLGGEVTIASMPNYGSEVKIILPASEKKIQSS